MDKLLCCIFLTVLLCGCGTNEATNDDSNSDSNSGNDGDVCSEFLGEDDGAGQACDEGSDCPSVDCPCDDGSSVGSTSCFNGICEGRDGCEEACQGFGAAYACADTGSNGDTNGGQNGDTNGIPNGDTNGGQNGDANGDTNGSQNGDTNGDVGTIPTGDPCPQFGCTPPIRPASTDCEECEEGLCFVGDGESYCTRSCTEAADCPASFDRATQRRCVADVCVKGIE